MKAVIMAGGEGSRISSLFPDIPKPMILIANKPVLEHQINCLKKQGIINIIIVVGYLGHIIKEYFKSGENFDVNIEYFVEDTPLGTAGALYYLRDLLTEDFLLINGDIIFDINFNKFFTFHYEKKASVTLFTHPNNHPYDSALICTNNNSQLVRWIHKETPREIYKNRVNAGIHIISRKLLFSIFSGKKIDLDRDILEPLVCKNVIFAYDSPEYVKDMGTPERYNLICEDYMVGRISAKNLSNMQRAIFLDRDGTLNEYAGFVTKPEQIKLINGVAEFVRYLNKSGYLAIVITNQPVIARGDCSIDELEIINNQLETLLGKEGAYIDAVYVCPHHPDKGFEGECAEYKMECNCRKPKPGLILKAAKDYNIDLSKSFMIGDDLKDVNAGLSAGCTSVLLCSDKELYSNDNVVKCENLIDFQNLLIRGEKNVE